MTKLFAPRGLAFWLTISLIAHLPLGAMIMARGEEEQTGELRPFMINLAGQQTRASGADISAQPVQTRSGATRTAPWRGAAVTPTPKQPLSGFTAAPHSAAAPPELQQAELPAKFPTDTASAIAGPVELPMTAEVANQTGADTATVVPSGELTTGAASGMPGSYAPPSYAAGNDPVYPPQARSHGWEGDVWLRLRIAADGSVNQIAIERTSLHAELDQAAVVAVKRWKFYPASRNGIAVEETVLLPLTFRLQPIE